MKRKRGAGHKTPVKPEQHQAKGSVRGAVARALAGIALLAIAGVALVTVWGRPKEVTFTSSFKAERLAPGSPLDLQFVDCAQTKFRAPKLRIPRDAYVKNKAEPRALDSTSRAGELEVHVAGGGPVTVDFGGDGERVTQVSIGRDGMIEVQPSTESTGLGAFNLSSVTLSLSMYAWAFTLTTPSDGDFTGFGDGITDALLGEISVDELEESQGGVPPTVPVSVPSVFGPVSIRGTRDEVAGWTPISLQTGPSEQHPVIANGRLTAEKVSSLTVSVNSEPAEIETAAENIQIDIVRATVTKLLLHQGASGNYIAFEVSGVTRSIKQNNKELVESEIARLLSKPIYQGGVSGLLLFSIVFAASVFLKRAFELLSEAWLTKR